MTLFTYKALLVSMSVFRQYGLRSCYSTISDSELDDMVRRQTELNDNVGSNSIIARLFVQGIKVCNLT